MKIEEAKQQLNQYRCDHSSENETEIISKIEKIEQPYRDILMYRYVLTMSWREITSKMVYSPDHLRGYMKKKALEKYAEVG